ncbi:MAG: MopE-related protein [Pseudomonadota bacterium]
MTHSHPTLRSVLALALTLGTAACAPFDVDGDGYIDQNAGGDDCNDGDPAVHPGAIEVCNGRDDDCDGEADEAGTGDVIVYDDVDGDGLGDPDSAQAVCEQGSGQVTNNDDCDDRDHTVGGPATWYPDADGDGYGDAAGGAAHCGAPEGWIADSSDCDDDDANRHPGAPEDCDGVDDDCDGVADDLAVGTWLCQDADGDGYGDPDLTAQVGEDCEGLSGWVQDCSDCDDTRADSHPNATEVECDGFDQDCAGDDDKDLDGDGFEGCGGPDCDDGDPSVSPSAIELCGDAVDNDCDEEVNEHDCEACDTWITPADSLQAAVTAAAADEVICLEPGTWTETVEIIDRDDDIAIIGVGGPAVTVLDGEGVRRLLVLEGCLGLVRLRGLLLRDGYSAVQGGCVWIDDAWVRFSDGSLTGCHAGTTGGLGGGAVAASGGATSLELERSDLDRNQAQGAGGALCLSGDAWASVTACRFRDNITSSGGGAIGVANNNEAAIEIINSELRGNSASSVGGGFYLPGSPDTRIENTLFIDNRAGVNGGGLYTPIYTSLYLDNVAFIGNDADTGGGADLSGPTSMENCSFHANTANYGGALMLANGWTYVKQARRTVITGQSVDEQGSAIYTDGSDIPFSDSDFWGNVTSSAVDECSQSGTGGACVGLADGPGNLSANPQYLDAAGEVTCHDQLILAASSPLVGLFTTNLDPGASTGSMGIFGGERGDDWDLDRDGVIACCDPGGGTCGGAACDADDCDENVN